MGRESKKSPEQLEKERNERKAKLMKEANVPLSEVLADASTVGDREYARKFRNVYVSVRKGLVHLQKQRQAKLNTNEVTYNKALELLKQFSEE